MNKKKYPQVFQDGIRLNHFHSGQKFNHTSETDYGLRTSP